MMQQMQETLANHEARIVGLERMNEERRASLLRIEDKLDGQTKWLMGVMASAILSLLATVFALLSGRAVALH